MTEKTRFPWLIFDYDDTLGGILKDKQVIGNDMAYNLAIDRFAAFMEELGFDSEEALVLQQEVDQHLCRQFGFSWKPRFAESMVRSYKTLASKKGQAVSATLQEVVHDIGMSVFKYRYMPLPGALDTLNALRPHYRIAVVTKGEESEQSLKVSASGVENFVDTVITVGFKNLEDWQKVFEALGIEEKDYPTTWAIGNSPKSDVNVPLRMGTNAIHVNQGGWSFEAEEYETPQEGRSLIVVDRVLEVLNHLEWS